MTGDITMTDKSGVLEYAHFSRDEMNRRYARARELMADRNIDALIVSNEENFQYLAGTSASLALHTSLTRPSIFVLPASGDPIIVTQGADNLSVACYVTDVRDYTNLLDFPLNVTIDALKDAIGNGGRIGAELGQEQRMGIPVGSYIDITKALAEVEFVDAADILIRLRMVKSSEEVAYVRKAADITGRARQRLFDVVSADMTEREVVRLMRQYVLEEGGDSTSFVILQQDQSGAKNQIPHDRRLTRGDILAVDAGARVGMYTCDFARMATLGKATDDQKRVHAAVLEVNQAMADALKPGVTCSEMHAIALRAIDKAGVEVDNPGRGTVGRMGHGQGILITEPPSLAASDHTVIEAGMVISTEPGVRSGSAEYLWEDVHVVTETGHEQITLETSELREISS